MRVCIVGGGFSGSLLCMELLRASPLVRISLIERRSRQLNRGVAYSARLSRQLLNVPAGRMGAFADDPEGFLRWARSGPAPGARADDFLPRSMFGDFVHDRFHDLVDEHAGRVELIRANAVSLTQHAAHGYSIRLHNGRHVAADVVVLALGNAPPGHVPNLAPEAQEHPAYVAWPWQHGALDRIGTHDPVLFVGSGLTMVDVLLSLAEQGHQGALTVLSRHGYLPRPHAEPQSWTFSTPVPAGAGLSVAELTAFLRTEAAAAEQAGHPWQSVLDAAKPHVRSWWQGLALKERQRFLRHMRPFWEVHRHRMPKEAHERLTEMQRSGRLRSLAASVIGIQAAGDALEVTYRERGGTDLITERTLHVINCTGPQTDARRMEQPFFHDLLRQGLARWDELHIGLDCKPSGALLNAVGATSHGLYAIGPLCKSALWECTAVPEIRAQAAALAATLSTAVGPAREDRPARKVFHPLDRLSINEA